jgi:hypothetical protein
MAISNLQRGNFVNLSIMPQTKSISPRLSPTTLSPTNINSFPFDELMTTTCPTKCIVPDLIGKILRFEGYYFKSEHVLCTRAFSVATVSTTVNDGEFPPGSTELDDETGHNCKMSKEQYRAFTRLVLGLDNNTWANQRTECAFRNLILQDLDAMLYYFDMDWQVRGEPVSPPGDITDMAIILT